MVENRSVLICDSLQAGLEILETQIMAESAFASSFASKNFKVFQGTPSSSLLHIIAAYNFSNKNRTCSDVQASTPPSHSILGVASDFSKDGWTVQRGPRYQLPKGRRATASSKIRGPWCSCQWQGIGEPGTYGISTR